MRILLRSDAGVQTGTGHVMRCLTLAEELLGRGHEVVLQGSLGDIHWLREQVHAGGVEVQDAETDTLDAAAIVHQGFDRVVVDSYRIPPAPIAILDAAIPVLAVIDGDDRGIRASAYLDQNLGAEAAPYRAHVAKRLLGGSRYALVRRDVLAERRDDEGRIRGDRPHVVAFMGGTDPAGAIVAAASSIVAADVDADLTVVSAPGHADEVGRVLADRRGAEVLLPTRDLPALLGAADVVVSAAGTSAWDVCTMGRPAVFAALVGNQQESLAQLLEAGLALGLDAAGDSGALREIGPLVARLLGDPELRRTMSAACLSAFDGRGAARVADALEALDPSR